MREVEEAGTYVLDGTLGIGLEEVLVGLELEEVLVGLG